MILITTENEVKAVEYPEGSYVIKELRGYIGEKCEMAERVQPRRLYTVIGAGSEINPKVPGEKVSMLCDEEFAFHCNEENQLNAIASMLYEADVHGSLILGNVLIVGEKVDDDGYDFCPLSDSQFDLVFGKLKHIEETWKKYNGGN